VFRAISAKLFGKSLSGLFAAEQARAKFLFFRAYGAGRTRLLFARKQLFGTFYVLSPEASSACSDALNCTLF
jgi:hypothetical protein